MVWFERDADRGRNPGAAGRPRASCFSDIARPGKAAGTRWAGNGSYSRRRRVGLENFH